MDQPPYDVECWECHAQPGLACVGEFMGRQRNVEPHPSRVLRSLASNVSEAYTEFIDTDVLDPLAEAIGKLRSAL